MLRLPALALAAGIAVTAVSGCESDQPDPAPPVATSTPLSEFPTTRVTVAREAFCSRVGPAAVEEALGGAPEDADSWANGDRAEVAPGVTDVAHEFGCRWSGPDGTTVRAWVFAPPVTPGQADALRAGAAHAKGCDPVPDAPRFGTRTVAVRCEDDGGVVTSYHGLFGDAWLSCSLSVPSAADDLLDRTGRWCVTVVQAASA